MLNTTLIFSPHPDDELIGCYRLLRGGRVKYVYYLDVDTDEYKLCAEEYGFEVVDNPESVAKLVGIILTPDPFERHPLHREAWLYGRKLAVKYGKALGFYSTQMDASYVDILPKTVAFEKRDALNRIYHSKSDMWKYEYKYWMYEGVVVRL